MRNALTFSAHSLPAAEGSTDFPMPLSKSQQSLSSGPGAAPQVLGTSEK